MSPSERAWRSGTAAIWGLAGVSLFSIAFVLVLPFFSAGAAVAFFLLAFIIAAIGFGTITFLAMIGPIPWWSKLPIFLAIVVPLSVVSKIYGFSNGLAATALLAVSLMMAAGGAGAATKPGRSRKGRIAPSLFALVGFAGLGAIAYGLFALNDEKNTWLAEYSSADRSLELPDPGVAGAYEIEYYTYGSGQDKNREEYGSQADWTSDVVDGSRLIDGWDGLSGWERTRFWGFDSTALPIQGRVWAPVGEGRFPLILIVHGNHFMEDFSDPGYAYLGEHLASRGFIVVSVDENFLNGSVAQRVGAFWGRLKGENDARGWMLLEHLKQWSEWTSSAGHPFFRRVDFSRIALAGHSRGGEAVATAAVFNGLAAYPDDATLAFDYNFNIGAVIAIAPVDGQYKPRKANRALQDVNYFVIHGGMDGDVSSFVGAAEYSRATFSGEAFRFKASLYVAGANHGQFNTSWGASDRIFPYAIFLDKKKIMPGEDQRKIAKVYFTAFLDATLNSATAYLPMFSDPAYATAWLPDAFLTGNYQDSEFQSVADYEDDVDPTTASVQGGISGKALTVWREENIQMKWKPLDTQAALVAWDKDVHSEDAAYAVRFDAPSGGLESGIGAISFAVAQAKASTKPKNWKPQDGAAKGQREADGNAKIEEDKAGTAASGGRLLDWSIVLVDAEGGEARTQLSVQSPLPPHVRASPFRAMRFGKTADSEVVLQRYTFPVEMFDSEAFDLNALREIRFEFDASPRGAIYIDDIGFALNSK